MRSENFDFRQWLKFCTLGPMYWTEHFLFDFRKNQRPANSSMQISGSVYATSTWASVFLRQANNGHYRVKPRKELRYQNLASSKDSSNPFWWAVSWDTSNMTVLWCLFLGRRKITELTVVFISVMWGFVCSWSLF